MTIRQVWNSIWESARWIATALVAGLLIWLLFNSLEPTAEDVMFQLRPAPTEPTHTVIVAIDDASFSANGYQWPWPRDYLAKIVEQIAAGKPKVIAIDIIFSERSDPARDQALAQTFASAGNIVLATNFTVESQGALTIQKLNRPIPEIDAAVTTLGLINFDRDKDGVTRQQLAFKSYNGTLYYSMAMQAVRLYDGAEDFDVVSSDRADIGARQVLLEGQHLRINYRGRAGTIPTVSAYQVANGLVDPAMFEGKIVLLGATSETLHDSYPTSFGSQPPTPGVEINANAIETILSGSYIRVTGPYVALAMVLIGTLVAIMLAIRLKPLAAVVTTVTVIVLYSGASFLVFIATRTLLPVIQPAAAMVLTFAIGASIQVYREQRQRAQVRSLFERYVTPAAIDQMLTQPETYASGGQRKELTILFSDIRGFTTLSENLPPDDVVAILNQYLARMTELIFEHDGTIDKFEGDAILAIWNAPLPTENHATRAVQCGMAMIEALGQLQEDWAQKSTAPLQIGVGINTGQAFVGNIGSARRMDYTVIGDTVNLASRLQDLTKAEGVPILFSETTRDQLGPKIATRFVAATQVKGRTQVVNVYTVDQAQTP